MKRIAGFGFLTLIILALATGAVLFFQHFNVAVLNPQGEIARAEHDLIIFTFLLGLVVILPVFVMLGLFAWRYRETNTKARYRPNWEGNAWLEAVWWGIPCVIILVLSVVTWQSSHQLDPYKSLESEVKPVNVQVVALQWKWLFIYPDLGVASVNAMQIPEKTPINFSVTSDAPMNAFWIPSLGGQVYAMSGMSTKLHLMADHSGQYKGSSANVSGKGFADMAFTVKAVSPDTFMSWVEQTKRSPEGLNASTYRSLALPASLEAPMYYKLEERDLYDTIVEKYMSHGSHGQTDDSTMEGM